MKRNEKFIRRLKNELARATLPHIRDPSNVVVEMALRHKEILDSLEKSKANDVQVGQNHKRKFFPKERKSEIVCFKCDKKGILQRVS